MCAGIHKFVIFPVYNTSNQRKMEETGMEMNNDELREQAQIGYQEFKDQLLHTAKADEPVDQIEVLKKVKGILDTIREDDA